MCSTLRALPRSPKEKEQKRSSDNHLRATEEVGEGALVLPHVSFLLFFVPLTLSNVEKKPLSFCMSGLHLCFLFSGQKFSLFFGGGGVAEVVRKLETEPPTVEVSQPGI